MKNQDMNEDFTELLILTRLLLNNNFKSVENEIYIRTKLSNLLDKFEKIIKSEIDN